MQERHPVDVLFGRAEPGGRLPETYPCRLEDTPSYLSFPHYPDTVPDVAYGEGVYIGYRWYDAKKLDVEYPFGYGLSYTSFAYSDIHLDKSGMSVNDNVTVSFIVKNTGSRLGCCTGLCTGCGFQYQSSGKRAEGISQGLSETRRGAGGFRYFGQKSL